MFFKLITLVFWLLALVAPVSDYRTYIMLLSDASIAVPDNPLPNNPMSESVVMVSSPAPAPAPVPSYSTPVVPLHFSIVKEPKHASFSLGKPIYKWIDTLYSRIIGRSELPVPTKTSDMLVESSVPVFQSVLATDSDDFDDVPVHSASTNPDDLEDVPAHSTSLVLYLVGILNAYKLVFIWILFITLAAVSNYIYFLYRHHHASHITALADPSVDNVHPSDEPKVDQFESIIDIYESLGYPPVPTYDNLPSIIDMYEALGYPPVPTCDDLPSILDMYDSLGYPPVTHDDSCHSSSTNYHRSTTTQTELPKCTHSSSACTHAASALPAWIDAKTGVEGSTEMNGACLQGKILEPAVSRSSIGNGITPSSSYSAIPLSCEELLARYPPTGQLHSLGSELWLRGLISHVWGMERRGDFLGRVYDDWTHPEAGPQAPEDDSARYGTKDSTDQSGYTTPNPQSTASPHMSSQPSFASELSFTSSQGSLYEQLGGLVNPVSEHEGTGRGRMGEGVERQANGGGTVRSPRLSPLDIPLPPSPIRPKANVARQGLWTKGTCTCK